MWCSSTKPWGARSPHNSLFCLVDTTIKSLPEKSLTNLFFFFIPVKEGGTARKSPSGKPVTTLLSVLQPRLKMAREDNEPLPYSAMQHRPHSGRHGAVPRREVSRWARG